MYKNIGAPTIRFNNQLQSPTLYSSSSLTLSPLIEQRYSLLQKIRAQREKNNKIRKEMNQDFEQYRKKVDEISKDINELKNQYQHYE